MTTQNTVTHNKSQLFAAVKINKHIPDMHTF